MRVWATGQAWWQGDAGPYWGHNAILRIAPFRAHCRLDKLPDGGTILSHDQVEAARLRAAGWGVAVWADDAGSYEANPPAMPEFLHRDGRWLAGNLQYRHLILLPGFRLMGRWQLFQAMLMFAAAPLHVAMFVLACIAAQTAPDPYPRGALLALALAWPAALYAPKLLGYLETLIFAERRARYGDGARFALGAAVEFGFMLLLDATSNLAKTIAIGRLALGAKPGWLPQNRSDRGVGWGEAARMFWPHTALGVVCFAALAWAAPAMALLALPFAGGLLVAVPLCVVTSGAGLSGWLRRHRLAAMPEELDAAA
jgi:membrane glycosyltransferase